jgi:hypothetical protein
MFLTEVAHTLSKLILLFFLLPAIVYFMKKIFFNIFSWETEIFFVCFSSSTVCGVCAPKSRNDDGKKILWKLFQIYSRSFYFATSSEIVKRFFFNYTFEKNYLSILSARSTTACGIKCVISFHDFNRWNSFWFSKRNSIGAGKVSRFFLSKSRLKFLKVKIRKI